METIIQRYKYLNFIGSFELGLNPVLIVLSLNVCS